MSFVEQFDAEGWLRVGGLFDAALLNDLRIEVARQFDGAGRQESLRVGSDRLMVSVLLNDLFLRSAVYAHPVLLRVLEQLLGADILIDSFTCVIALPGAGEQRLHRDHAPLFPERPQLGAELPPYAITAVIPLVDLTPETGTTRVFPGTHRGAQPDRAENPYVSRGECFLMDYRLLHQGTPNRSAEPRPVIYVVYARPWFTDVVNFHSQPRINLNCEDLQRIPSEHHPLFRRISAQGSTCDVNNPASASDRSSIS
jgi:ectoine hydroxylase-related dioxygenase (phytanoyl-CoA dioxygenase family)